MAVTLKTGWMKRVIDGVSTRVYAQSHAKCCCYGSPEQGVTVQDKIETLGNKVEECFLHVSDGKGLLVATLTEGGVITADSASFDTINKNIKIYGDNRYEAGRADAAITVVPGIRVSDRDDSSGTIDPFVLSAGTYLYSVNAVNGYNGAVPSLPTISVSVSKGIAELINESASTSGIKAYASLASKTAVYLLELPEGAEVNTSFSGVINTDANNGTTQNGCVVKLV